MRRARARSWLPLAGARFQRQQQQRPCRRRPACSRGRPRALPRRQQQRRAAAKAWLKRCAADAGLLSACSSPLETMQCMLRMAPCCRKHAAAQPAARPPLAERVPQPLCTHACCLPACLQILAANQNDVGPDVIEAVSQLEPAVSLDSRLGLSCPPAWRRSCRSCAAAAAPLALLVLRPPHRPSLLLPCSPALRAAASLPLHTHTLPALCAPQGVPSVARAAAVTGIHDPALLEVSWGSAFCTQASRVPCRLPSRSAAAVQTRALHAWARAGCTAGLQGPICAAAPLAALQVLAEAAVRAMPQLSAADICSVVESFSGEQSNQLSSL